MTRTISIQEIEKDSNPAWRLYQALEPFFGISDVEAENDDRILELYQASVFSGNGLSGDPVESIRKMMSRIYCCGVPSPPLLRKLSEYSPIVEFGAGNGYWANQLSSLGATIEALDTNLDNWENFYFPVAEAEAFRFAQEKTLLLVWPSDGLNWPNEIIRKHPWQKIIYIGEPRGGRMANDEFFDYLENFYELMVTHPAPNYPLWNCQLAIYSVKGSTQK